MTKAIFNEDTDMSSWDLGFLQDAHLVPVSDTKFVLNIEGENSRWVFAGTDFTYDDGGVTGGMVSRITVKDIGSALPSADFSGINQPIADIRAAADANDVPAFQALLFGGDDKFIITSTATTVLWGLGGNDKFDYGGNFTNADKVDGGAGKDTVVLDGNYSGGLFFSADTMVNVENVLLGSGHDYFVVFADSTVAAGDVFKVNAAALGSGNYAVLSAESDTDGRVKFTGGDGADALFGGAGGDTLIGNGGADFLKGNGGADKLTGGAGADLFVYHHTGSNLEGLDSNSTGFDTVFDFDATNDQFDVAGKAIVYDGTVSVRDLNHLAPAGFAADHALLVTINNGQVFLVVNSDGVAGYQAGSDLVVRLDGAQHLDSFNSADFISF